MPNVFSPTYNLLNLKAPEFPEGLPWLNSQPLRLYSVLGRPRAVLIDFWTYSCINCLRTLPALKNWHSAYTSLGLCIIGVHAPEFAFEKKIANVRRAAEQHRLAYPIVLDNDHLIWQSFSNHWWPRKLLINPEGRIVYDHAGEGKYRETESAIRATLTKINPQLDLPAATSDNHRHRGGVCIPATQETYLGYGRGRIGNGAGYLADAQHTYHFPQVPLEKDTVYLEGRWQAQKECLVHPRDTVDFQDYLALPFSALTVNLVAGARLGPHELLIKLNGDPLPSAILGEDVTRNAQGGSVCVVDDHRLYQLIRASRPLKGTLKVLVKSAGVELYAFTFGGCSN